MKTQKPKRSKWFSLVVGGIAFVVLAGTAAEARKYVTDYQANPNGYVVAVNNTTNQIMIQIKETAQRDKLRLEQRYNRLNVKSKEKNLTYKARLVKGAGGFFLKTALYVNGVQKNEVKSPLGVMPADECPASEKAACAAITGPGVYNPPPNCMVNTTRNLQGPMGQWTGKYNGPNGARYRCFTTQGSHTF